MSMLNPVFQSSLNSYIFFIITCSIILKSYSQILFIFCSMQEIFFICSQDPLFILTIYCSSSSLFFIIQAIYSVFNALLLQILRTVMSDKDSNQIEDLNQSRFLIEQLNLQQQPTQQEVLERAEQLEIDDLILARESLTKQLQPEWRPYCNRHSEIYYINLLERLAYVDHPIDMYFKIEYAKNNGLPIPRFKNFKLEQISSNLELIEQQIRNFKMRSHKTTLRIVYEEPSQQQAISSHPKSPENGNQYDFQFEKDNQQLNVQQMQQLYAYERELQQKYEQQYLKNKKQMNNKEKRLADDHENFMRHLLDSKAEELSMKYEQQIMNKNKVDLRKQNEKIQNEYQQKRWQFCETIHKFNSVFQQLRDKQRNIDVIYESKEASEKRTIVTAMEQKRQLQKLRAIEETKAKIMKQFNERLISINSNSEEYQSDLKNSLQDLYRQVTKKGPKIIQRKRIFHQKGVEGDIGTRNRIERDFQYEQLKKEIKDLCLWSNSSSQISISDHHFSKPLRSSLNLRLRMRIL